MPITIQGCGIEFEYLAFFKAIFKTAWGHSSGTAWEAFLKHKQMWKIARHRPFHFHIGSKKRTFLPDQSRSRADRASPRTRWYQPRSFCRWSRQGRSRRSPPWGRCTCRRACRGRPGTRPPLLHTWALQAPVHRNRRNLLLWVQIYKITRKLFQCPSSCRGGSYLSTMYGELVGWVQSSCANSQMRETVK
jgi:hypothetical protein